MVVRLNHLLPVPVKICRVLTVLVMLVDGTEFSAVELRSGDALFSAADEDKLPVLPGLLSSVAYTIICGT